MKNLGELDFMGGLKIEVGIRFYVKKNLICLPFMF